MSDAKPLASLGASLLARKGSAKPAMRPQSARAAVSSQAAAQNLEDLGWDDMGDEDNAANHTAEVLSLTPSPHNKEAEALTDTASPKPKVRSMHEELALRLAEEEAKVNPAAKKQALPQVTAVKKQALPPIDLDKARAEPLGWVALGRRAVGQVGPMRLAGVYHHAAGLAPLRAAWIAERSEHGEQAAADARFSE